MIQPCCYGICVNLPSSYPPWQGVETKKTKAGKRPENSIVSCSAVMGCGLVVWGSDARTYVRTEGITVYPCVGPLEHIMR